MCIKFKTLRSRGPNCLLPLRDTVYFVELSGRVAGVVGDHQRRYHTALRRPGAGSLLIRNKAEVDGVRRPTISE